MPQPVSPKITSTPAVPGMPYDPVDGDTNTAPWVKIDDRAGPCDLNTGAVVGKFATDGDWAQT